MKSNIQLTNPVLLAISLLIIFSGLSASNIVLAQQNVRCTVTDSLLGTTSNEDCNPTLDTTLGGDLITIDGSETTITGDADFDGNVNIDGALANDGAAAPLLLNDDVKL